MGGLPLRPHREPPTEVAYGVVVDVQDPDAIQARINGNELSLRLGDVAWYLPQPPHLALELLDRTTDQLELLRDHLNTRQVQLAETFAARETNERFAGLNAEPPGSPAAQPIRIVGGAM